MYKVIRDFKDKKDKKRIYRKGDTYPREGYTPSQERVDELLSGKNKNRQIYLKPVEPVKEVADEQYPKPTKEGSTWFILSNGEKVQGKEAAMKAEDALKAGE